MGAIYDDYSIDQFKNRIETKLNIPASQQLLRYKEMTLWHDHRTLRQYRIHDGAIIHLRVYTEQKIKKLRQQYIFSMFHQITELADSLSKYYTLYIAKSIDKAYKALEPEFAVTDVSESDLRSVVDPRELYELAFKEGIEWQNLDDWMRLKLELYLHQIEMENSTPYKNHQRNKPRVRKARNSIHCGFKCIPQFETDEMRGMIVDGYIREFNQLLANYHFDVKIPQDINTIISVLFKEGIYVIRFDHKPFGFSVIKDIHRTNAIVSDTGYHQGLISASRVYGVDDECVIDTRHENIMKVLGSAQTPTNIYFMKVCFTKISSNECKAIRI